MTLSRISPARWLTAGALVAMLFGGGILLHVRELRLDVLEMAEVAAVSAATTTTARMEDALEILGRTVGTVEEVIRFNPDGLRRDNRALHDLLARQKALSPLIKEMAIISIDGLLLAEGQDYPSPPLVLLDRDYVQQGFGGTARLFIGRPVVSRRGLGWLVPVSRPIYGPDGQVIAVVAAAFDPAQLAGLVAVGDLPAGTTAGVRLVDGPWLTCAPQWQACVGRSDTDPAGVAYGGHDGVAGAVRIRSVASPHYPLEAVVVVEKASVLAPWTALLSTLVALGIVGSLGAAVGGVLLYRFGRRSDRAMVALADSTTRFEARVRERTEELEHLARTDALTGALSRRAFLADGERNLVDAGAAERPVAVMMIDADHFKRINDHYGHAVGDAVLRDLTDALRQVLRASDLLGRLGGEEFAVVLPRTPAAGCAEVADRIVQAVRRRRVDGGGAAIRYTVSIGWHVLTPEEARAVDGLAEALRHADAALYRAKATGRDRVVASLAAPEGDASAA
ncbi:diguanylate cyclase [Caenispirillum bisanense]|uniref:diguanylate cyclase n=1 Tax=Caenispirillum bisanense TaxID=414052 RepID=A0A286GF06_9PROT|nr:diguanylate cyclase [Caenispirillum bisanense]SOD93594.1 diguanylate cyclase (GGDEF) domain-containing protein [Caenispirillum bisanense]